MNRQADKNEAEPRPDAATENAKNAANEAERHKTGVLPEKAGKKD